MFNVCSLCRKIATLRCGECKSEIYCSTLCQSEAWKVHKKLCNLPNTSGLFVTQPDLTITEAEVIVKSNQPCECCIDFELDKRPPSVPYDCTPESMLKTINDTSGNPEGKNLSLIMTRSQLINELNPILLKELRIFIKKERLLPFYRAGLVQNQIKTYFNKIDYEVPKLAQLALEEFFNYFTIIEVVKDLKRAIECRDSSMKRLKPLMERIKKSKTLGWIEYMKVIKD